MPEIGFHRTDIDRFDPSAYCDRMTCMQGNNSPNEGVPYMPDQLRYPKRLYPSVQEMFHLTDNKPLRKFHPGL